jgi:hypothetical protein
MRRVQATCVVAAMLLLGPCLGIGPARADDQATVSPETVVVPPERLAEEVTVRDLRTTEDGEVSGVVENRSGKPLRDVQLLIRYGWLWNNERSPGADAPGRAVYYTLPGELPAGGTRDFTYRPTSPLPARSDGRYQTTIEVAGLTEIIPPGSSTAGVGSGAPGSTRYTTEP